MPAGSRPALSPEQWSGRDLAKLGLSYDDCVIALNRAHDCVLVRTWRPYGGPLSSSPGTKRERLFAAWPIASRLFCHRRLPNPRGDK